MILVICLYFAVSIYCVTAPNPQTSFNMYRVEANSECSQGAATEDQMSLSEKNSQRIQYFGRIRVILHKDEGCIKRGTEFKLKGYDRTRIRVAEVFLVPFKYLSNGKKKYLMNTLKTQTEEQLMTQSFYLLDFELMDKEK